LIVVYGQQKHYIFRKKVNGTEISTIHSVWETTSDLASLLKVEPGYPFKTHTMKTNASAWSQHTCIMRIRVCAAIVESYFFLSIASPLHYMIAYAVANRFIEN